MKTAWENVSDYSPMASSPSEVLLTNKCGRWWFGMHPLLAGTMTHELQRLFKRVFVDLCRVNYFPEIRPDNGITGLGNLAA